MEYGGEPREPNWLPTTPDSRKIFFRQFLDRWDEEPASYRIERIGMDSPPPPPTHETMLEAMRWAGDFVHDAVEYWPEFLWRSGALCNPEAVNRFDGAALRASRDRSPDPERDAQEMRRGRLLTQMRWALEPGEALVVEFQNLDSFWMLTNEAIFGNSMDFRYRPVSYTPSRTAVDPDGRVRLGLAYADPGYHNWVDTTGFGAGVLTFRNVMDLRMPEFRTTVVKQSGLAGVMPGDSLTVTREERSRKLLERFYAVQRRYRI